MKFAGSVIQKLCNRAVFLFVKAQDLSDNIVKVSVMNRISGLDSTENKELLS